MSLLENWLVLGLGAALIYGISAVLAKVALGEKFLDMNPKVYALLTLIGLAIVLLGYYFTSPSIPTNPVIISTGIAVGILFGLGNLLVLIALENNAKISQLAPIYNINTLIAVVLGIFLLAEIPSQTQAVKVLIGGILITVGAILVGG